MFGTQEYLDRQFPNAYFSEILFAQGVISAGVTTAFVDYNPMGATHVFISGIFISSIDVAGPVLVTFTDQLARVLFQVHALSNAIGFYEINEMIPDFNLVISANIANANFVFSVQHQYLKFDAKQRK